MLKVNPGGLVWVYLVSGLSQLLEGVRQANELELREFSAKKADAKASDDQVSYYYRKIDKPDVRYVWSHLYKTPGAF